MLQLVMGEITFGNFFSRLWNDFVSIVSSFWMVARENAIFNVVILLPFDILWVILQFFWWIIQVIYIQWWFVWEGIELFLGELYVVAYLIIMDNDLFQTWVSDNVGFYIFVWILWPIYIIVGTLIYLFAGAAAFCSEEGLC